MLTRRTALALPLATATPVFAQAQTPTKLTIATGVDPSFAQFYVGKEGGFFERNGLDVTVNTGPSGVRLTVGNLYTDPSGGMCTTTAGPKGCYDHPGAQLAISTTWTKYQIPFDSLTQAGFGNPSPLGAQFPRGAIVQLKWDLGIPATGPTPPWELWIDDLTFY